MATSLERPDFYFKLVDFAKPFTHLIENNVYFVKKKMYQLHNSTFKIFSF